VKKKKSNHLQSGGGRRINESSQAEVFSHFKRKLSGKLATKLKPNAISPSLIVVFISGGAIRGLKKPSEGCL